VSGRLAPPLDTRRNAVRPDLADERLRGRAYAERFVAGLARRVAVPSAALRRRPAEDAPLDTELVFGEPVTLFSREGDWAWVQSVLDDYVGYVPFAAIAPARGVHPLDPASAEPLGPEATHRVHVPLAIVFTAPSIKSPVAMRIPMGARLCVVREESAGDERFLVTDEGYVLHQHALPLAEVLPDWVSLAETFVGAPYLYGGKTWDGIDCSGLVQLAVQAAGGEAPRDSDMQEAELGEPRAAETESLARGDLVFWKGHVGVMVDGARLLHANGFHMQTVVEPLAHTLARLEPRGIGTTSVRRLPLRVAPAGRP